MVPKISVILPVYNVEEYLDEAIQSIISQTIGLEYIEVIFVDDGSPDESLDIVLSLREGDKNIKVIELSRNFGHHKAIMTGLGYAQGDYVFLIDCDLEEEPELLNQFCIPSYLHLAFYLKLF